MQLPFCALSTCPRRRFPLWRVPSNVPCGNASLCGACLGATPPSGAYPLADTTTTELVAFEFRPTKGLRIGSQV